MGPADDTVAPRRTFLRQGGALAGLALALGPGGLLAQAPPSRAGEAPGTAKAVSPVEDLLQEHAVLSRILLIYEEIQRRLRAGAGIPGQVLARTVKLNRRFVEDYHEKLEEEHVFPRFLKAGQMTALVKVLLQQHQAGRQVTDALLQLGDAAGLRTAAPQETLARHLGSYLRMYRPHASHEGTVLFQAFRSLVSAAEYAELGEKFEDQEEARFGKGGFGKIVGEVENLETALNIANLSQFTPKL